MSVAVCRGAAVMPTFDVVPNWCAKGDDHQHRPAQLDIWNTATQPADKEKAPAAKKPYIHPLVRRRSMSHRSLEVCTESLGCETGDFLSFSLLDDTTAMGMPWLCAPSPAQPEAEEEPIFLPPAQPEAEEEPIFLPPAMALDLQPDKLGDDDTLEQQAGERRISKDELTAVHYHCSRPQRAFPPPLPSMSRRDGPCLQMRPHRRDGRLVVQAVPVRHHGYLHAQRQGGRLRLCFVDCSLREQSTTTSNTVVQEAEKGERLETEQQDQHDDGEGEEEIIEEEHDEVEVVDRGTVVEVTVSSTQPQVAAAAGKVHRSRLVINKFVGSAPLSDDHQPAQERCVSSEEPAAPAPGLRRVPSSTTTLAAAVAVASTTAAGEESGVDEEEEECGEHAPLLFTSRVGDTQELVQSVRRCRQLRQKPLFILEPYCIATS